MMHSGYNGFVIAVFLLVLAVAILILFAVATSLFRIVKNSPAWVLWLITLLGGGGFLVIVLMLGLFLFWQGSAPPTVMVKEQHLSDRIAPISPQRRAVAEDEDPDSFVANIYPGVVQCGAPMAYLISDAIKEMEREILQKNDLPNDRSEAEADIKAEAEDPEDETAVLIKLENENLNKQDYAELTRRFQKQMKTLMPSVAFDEDAIRPDEKAESFKLSFRSIGNSQGKLICEISAADITRRYGVDFIPKLWLTDFSKWKSLNRDHQYIIGRCESFEPSGADARTKAIDDAKRQMETLWPGSTKLAVRPRLYEHVDSFSQKFSRPYGDVYRQSVLYQLNNVTVAGQSWGQGWTPGGSDSRLAVPISSSLTTAMDADAIKARAVVEVHPRNSRRRSSLSLEFFVAMLVVATVVLGTLSNVFTQGYYRSQISASVVGLILLGVAGLIFLLVGA